MKLPVYIKTVQLLIGGLLICSASLAQQFNFPTSGNAVSNALPALTAADGVTLITTIRSTGCTPGGSSTFRYATDHVSTGAIYRNTSWAAGCIGSTDIIKMDFTSQGIRPQGLKFSIYDVDNGSDSVSVLMYRGIEKLEYSYALYAPTFVSAHGASPSFGFVGSGSNNSGLDDNRGRIDIACTDILARVDSVIVTKYNNRDVNGNPSQSFAAFEWTNFIVLPLKILSFNASLGQNGLKAEWTATGESSTDTYQLTNSGNGVDFTAVGTTIAAKIAANTNSYSYQVPLATKTATVFIRLQSRDKNGNLQFSNIVKINAQGQIQSTVYPVVFKDQVTLTVQTDQATKAIIILAGMDGTIHYQQATMLNSGSNVVALSLPQRLSAGVYRLYYRLQNGAVQQHAIIKQ